MTMKYDMLHIANLSTEVGIFEIYKQLGSGVHGDPHRAGKVLKQIRCSEIDAFIIAEAMNIERNGIVDIRTPWAEPTIQYRKVK